MKAKIVLFSLLMSLGLSTAASAHETDLSGVELVNGNTGTTYTWTTPLDTQITMPVITKDALIRITDENGGHDYYELIFFDPSGQLPVKKTYNTGYGYKNKGFAIATLILSKSREYTPVTIKHFNTGEPVLSAKHHSGWNGQDVIVAFYTYFGDQDMREDIATLEGGLFQSSRSSDVEFFYVTMNNNTAGWRQDSRGWWYQKADGTWYANDWLLDNGTWYYFNADGYMCNGWVMVKDSWYYFDNSGAMLSNTKSPDGYTLGADGRYIP